MRPAAACRRSLVVTVDVEADDLWSKPRRLTTQNARALPMFHALCRAHAMRPVYLVTHEMATDPDFVSFGRDVVRRNDAEIGMHLHPWTSPPDRALTDRDDWHQPFATQYPVDLLRDKAARLTRRLEDTFQVPIRSHRGGRWALNEAYARILVDLGYEVDSSVTPGVDWRGHDASSPAPDYTAFPAIPYFMDLDDLRRPGASPLLEVPMTTCRVRFDRGAGQTRNLGFVRWLRPNGRNGRALRQVADDCLAEGRPCLVLMVHSSELMPGTSPASRRREDAEAIFRDLGDFFAAMDERCRSATLRDLHQEMSGRLTPGGR